MTSLASLFPSGLSFRDPLFLLLLVAVPIAIALRILRERRGDSALVVPTLAFVARVRPGWRVRFRHVPFVLACLGFAGLVVALARPRVGLERTESWTEGVDIVVALDASGSMAAEDFKPKNRFFVAKAATRTFVEGRPQDRLGLIAFAGRSRTVVPLTTDRTMLLTRLSELKMGEQGDGTAIGMALGNSLARLGASKAKSKVVVLVTDGGNNAGEIDPDTAANVAKGLGIRVYTVGVGTAGGPVEIPVPVRDPETGQVVERRVMAQVDVDEKLLGRIAETTGGRFFRATDPAGLAETYAEIDRLEKTEVKTTTFTRWRETFPRVAVPAAALLALAAGLALFAFPVTPR
ncbi:MAG: VWA domain-containing protein [Holophagales bacterium]|jgi:Ca-activated chloride channel family protein|nr:VWA domain-containing protein [Holophagales bacterium]MBK9967405.1 VWA domain-containing protein [Holophagales bacterium]